MPRTYIDFTFEKSGVSDEVMRYAAERAHRSGWTFKKIDALHNGLLPEPAKVAGLFRTIGKESTRHHLMVAGEVTVAESPVSITPRIDGAATGSCVRTAHNSHKLKSSSMISLRLSTLLLICFAFSASVQAQEDKIDIGGHALEVSVTGGGNPVVVFEAGLGDDRHVWDCLIPFVAQFGTAFTYSRAGLGESDEGPYPRTLQRLVDELHAVLATAKVGPPFVLVGHSMGGLLIRMYASQYPDEVAGLVVVDGSHARQYAYWQQADPEGYEQALQQSEADLVDASHARRSEWEAFHTRLSRMDSPTPEVPDMPIAVVTSLDKPSGQEEPWRGLHQEWLVGKSNGLHLTTSRSGHYIQRSEPDLVLTAIRYVVDQWRTARAAESD